jgi:uncharacterized protein (DUF1684 family)
MPVLLIALLFLAAVPGYQEEITQWRQKREASLKAEDGWLSVSGLFWLKEGYNRIGTSPNSTVKLPRGPANAAILTMHTNRVLHIVANPGASITVNGKPVTSADLRSDENGATPDVVGIGNLKMFVIHRGSKNAIRLKDPEAATRRQFTGLKWFPIQPAWKIEAKFVTYPQPKKMVFETMVGEKEEDVSPGYAEFQKNGQQFRLEATAEGNSLFFVFRDKTAGKSTYPAARFLYSAMPKDGKVVLDFNRAYNPPCVFTAFATCPLPTPQNRLTIEIPAGEMMYQSSLHP